MTSEDSLSSNFSSLMNTWLHLKEQANKTGDYGLYLWFLRELKKNFGKVYVGFTNEKWIALFDDILKTITCEIKENVIKSKNKSMAEPKKKPIAELTNDELVKAYQAGTSWLTAHGHVSNTDKDASGETYNDELWQRALNRVERIENEMKKRGLAI